MDRTSKSNMEVNGRIKTPLEGNIITNLIAPNKGGKIVQTINPNDYTTNVTYSSVNVNKRCNKVSLLEEQDGNLPINVNHINVSTTSGISIPNATPLTDNANFELNKVIPSHKIDVNKSSNVYYQPIKNQKHLILDRNRPIATAYTSLGRSGYGTDLYNNGSRTKKLKLKIRPKGGIEGKATIPRNSLERNTQFKSNNKKINVIRQTNISQGTRF